MSKIEWTEKTWNPVVGCSRVSEGCRNCYAERMAATRLVKTPAYAGVAEMTKSGPRWTGKLNLLPDRLDQPLRWKKPRMVFVNSMSDLFHEDVPEEFIRKVFLVMWRAQSHTFQVLTKRPGRMRSVLARLDNAAWPQPLPNVWLGTSIEDQATADERIPLLLETPAAVRFLSAEPLLGPVDLANLVVPQPIGEHVMSALECDVDPADDHPYRGACLDWVIVGGESGPGARPMHPDWARSIRDQCVRAKVPFFLKQRGEFITAGEYMDRHGTTVIPMRLLHGPVRREYVRVGKKAAGRELDGRTWDEFPEAPCP